MTDQDLPLLILLIAALLVAVFLALAEASLLRVSEFRVHSAADDGNRRAVRLLGLLERLPEVLNLILLLALLAQIGAATITGVLAQRWFGNVGVTITSALLTIVLFVYGEAIPKTYAVRHAERTAMMVSGPIALLDRVLRPLVSLLVWIADIQAPGKGITTSPTVTEDELRLLTYRAAHEGEITKEDRDLIERAFRFGDRRADDIMVPRPDIVAIPSTATIDSALETALAHGHRRLPVYADTLESITGVVALRDLIAARDHGAEGVETLATPPLVTPESKRVTSLLADMQAQQNHLAIVVDEYGVTVGLVTVEDVAEELLGTISRDEEAPELTQVGPTRWSVAGSMPVEDLSRLGMEVPEGDWNTVAGLMMGITGSLMDVGDEIDVHDFTLTVERVGNRRIVRVSVERLG
ncbi:MAG: hemolysin family protein [Acidimicrobiia bacterium]|jgi:CBS domain containing-hemolysin-like protein